MDVLKARDIFYRWTEICLEQYLSGLTEQQKFAIRLIPLIFQTNHRLLPAYVGVETAAGIYGYKPAKQLLREAKKINPRFAYDQPTALKNTVINALYLQLSVLDDSVNIILIHKSEIKTKQKQQLKIKMNRLIRWLENEQLHINGIVLSLEQLISPFRDENAAPQPPGSSYVDRFYFESILLAGKYPLWWLIPPEADSNYRKMVDHIEHARYVNEHEYLDFGPASEFNINIALNSIMNLIQQGHADNTLLFRYCLSWQSLQKHSNGLLSAALKTELFDNQQDLQSLSIKQIFIQIIRRIVKILFGAEELEKLSELYSTLIPFSDNKLQPLLLEQTGHSGRGQLLTNNTENNLTVFMGAKNNLQTFVAMAAGRIIEQLTQFDVKDDDIELLTEVIENYHLQFNSHDLLVVINQTAITAIIQEKILIRELASSENDSQWALVVKDEQGDEHPVYQLKSLLALIAWAWLNRIVDQNTQVSIDCPGYQVKQIEARYALEVLVRQLSNDFRQQTEQYETDKLDCAVKSLVFVRFISTNENESLIEQERQNQSEISRQVLLFEQVLINRWGDVHYRLFYGNQGIVRCLCDWLDNVDLNDEHSRQNFRLFAYSSGETNYHVHRLGQIHDELMAFFVEHNNEPASYIFPMGIHYFVISQQQGKYSYQQIVGELALYQYLELATVRFKSVCLHKDVLSDTPLAVLFQTNRIGVVQFCFRGKPGQYDIWVVDERGSLWHCKLPFVDFEKLVSHWLLFIRNIVAQYQKAEITVPGFELFYSESDAAGDFKLSKVNTDGMSVKVNEPSLCVMCQDLIKGDELSFQVEDTLFDYLEYGEGVLNQCAGYISRNYRHADYLVSDVALSTILPGSSAAMEIQFVNFLKLKRRVEFELRQLLPGP